MDKIEAKVIKKTISYGNQRYRTDGDNWEALMFGTYSPACKGIPSYKWMLVLAKNVPNEVRGKA